MMMVSTPSSSQQGGISPIPQIPFSNSNSSSDHDNNHEDDLETTRTSSPSSSPSLPLPTRQSRGSVMNTTNTSSNGVGPSSSPSRPKITSNMQPRRQASRGLPKLHLSPITSLNRPKVSAHPSWATTPPTTAGENNNGNGGTTTDPNSLNFSKLSPLLEQQATVGLRSKLSSVSDESATAATTTTSTRNTTLMMSSLTDDEFPPSIIDATTNNNNNENIIMKEEFVIAQRELIEAAMKLTKIATGGNSNQDKEKEKEGCSVLYQKIWESSFDSIVVTDHNGHIKYVNPTFQNEFGYVNQEHILEKDVSILSGSHSDDDDDEEEKEDERRRSILLTNTGGEVEVLYSKRKDETEFLSIVGAKQLSSIFDPSADVSSSDDDGDEQQSSTKDYTVFFIRNISRHVNDPKLIAESQVSKGDSQTTTTEQQQNIVVKKLRNQIHDMENQIQKQEEELFEKSIEAETWENSANEYEIQAAVREGLISALVESLGVDDETKLTDELATLFKNYDNKVQQCKLLETSLETQTQKTNNLELKIKELEQKLLQGGETSSSTMVLKSEGGKEEAERASNISSDAAAAAVGQQELMNENEKLKEDKQNMEEFIDRLQGEMRDTMQVASELQIRLKSDNEKLFEDNRQMQNYIRDLEEETSAIEIEFEEVTKLNEEYRMEIQKIRKKEDDKAAKKKDNDTFMEDLIDSAIMTDFDGNILRVNDVTVNMFGYKSKNDLVGKDLSILLGEKNHHKLVETFNKLSSSSTHTEESQQEDVSSISSPKSKVMKNRLIFGHKKNGKEILCSVSFKDGGGDNNMIGFLRDMSGLKGKTIPYEGGKYKASEKGIPLSLYTTTVDP